MNDEENARRAFELADTEQWAGILANEEVERQAEFYAPDTRANEGAWFAIALFLVALMCGLALVFGG